MSSSPPTDRVVAIVELLLATDAGRSISEISETLRLNRSTCAAILGALEHHGWAERGADRTYRAGAGLLPVANAVLARVPVAAAARTLLQRLHDETGYPASLSRVADDHTDVVASAGRQPGEVTRLPMVPPFGAVVMAFRTVEERRRWLAQAPDAATRKHLEQFLVTVRAEGVGIWRLDEAMELVAEAMRALATVGADTGRLSELLLRIGRFGYLTSDLQRARTLPVSYLAAPVFGPDGRPQFELELHVLRPDVSRAEVRRLVTRLLAVAGELTAHGGGTPPR